MLSIILDFLGLFSTFNTSGLVSFSILSALEAAFRIDYLTRCNQKKEDSLSKKMREIYQNKENCVSLEKTILKL